MLATSILFYSLCDASSDAFAMRMLASCADWLSAYGWRPSLTGDRDGEAVLRASTGLCFECLPKVTIK